tara:strand:+ start:539 stop:721 length:183 start_codon:yes stop_codon:yes gene_type:complete
MWSDAIISMIIVSATGIIGLALKLCYSSKCLSFKFCGAEVIRDTAHEVSINVGNQTPNNI